jgi:hypothetical protein
MENILEHTKCTVIGPMENNTVTGGQSIRQYFKDQLRPMGITVFDHYDNPLLGADHTEGVELTKDLLHWRNTGQYDKIERLSNIRDADLALITKSDFIVFDYRPRMQMCGSWEELFFAHSLQKPIFVFVDGGVSKASIWLFWTLSHRYIYDTKEQVITMLQQLNDGTLPLDPRWKLLRKDFR